jgi:hypothetical protein
MLSTHTTLVGSLLLPSAHIKAQACIPDRHWYIYTHRTDLYFWEKKIHDNMQLLPLINNTKHKALIFLFRASLNLYTCPKAQKIKFTHNRELSVKSTCLHPVFGPCFSIPFNPFSGMCKVGKFLLNLHIMKCWNSAFNAQGLRITIVVLQALKKKERQDETRFGSQLFCFEKNFIHSFRCLIPYNGAKLAILAP